MRFRSFYTEKKVQLKKYSKFVQYIVFSVVSAYYVSLKNLVERSKVHTVQVCLNDNLLPFIGIAFH